MVMPGRKYTAGSVYRYGFNGQERSTELGDDNYTAEFWQYDGRLGRRWNVDPIDKEYESPYAAFGNNPIWNIDPTGADTAKYLSGTQILDAIKIGFNVIDNDIKNKKYNIGNDRAKELQTAVDDYASQHPGMSFGAYAEFRETVFDYFGGLNEIAFAKKTAWDQLSNQLNNPNIDELSQIRGVIARIQTYNGFGLSVITAGANVGVGLSAGAVGIKPGSAPKGPQINSKVPSTSPKYYRGGNDFTFKPNDVKLDANGMVKPTHGVSLFSSAQKIPTKFTVYRVTSLPKELQIIQRGKDLQHFEIVPKRPMTPQDFQKALNQIKTEPIK
jgi:RHS repeat-associated protein